MSRPVALLFTHGHAEGIERAVEVSRAAAERHGWDLVTGEERVLVLEGRLKLEFRDREVWLEKGQLCVVPHGVEHRPVAPEEVHIMLVEPAGTRNTGDEETQRTVEAEWI